MSVNSKNISFFRAFNGDLATCESLVEKYKDRGQGVEDEDDRDVAQLLIDQVWEEGSKVLLRCRYMQCSNALFIP